MKSVLKAAMAIDELRNDLENIANDDKKEIDQYTDKEILIEAKHVLDMFVNGTNPHWNYEDLQGENGPEQQKWARAEVRKLNALIKKFA